MLRTSTRVGAMAGLFFVLLSAASADVQLFGGPSTGMAGAGLALPTNKWSLRANPALYGYHTGGVKLLWPEVNLYTSNISLSDLQGELDDVTNGGLDFNGLSDFARDFGNNTKQFGAGVDLGLSFSNAVVSVSGSALVRTTPNALLREDVRNDTPIGNFNLGDQLDGYGYGYYSFDLAYGHTLPTPPSNPQAATVALGGRLRVIKSYYAHHFVSGQSINDQGDSEQALEMHGEDVLDKNGVGFDAGVHFTFGQLRNQYAGLQIRNLIEPRVGYDATLPADRTHGDIGETTVNPFKRMFDLGYGASLCDRALVAVDWVDVANNGNQRELRFGVDFAVTKSFSVQAGYSTENGVAFGVGIGGFNVAIAKNAPFELTKAFRF